MIPINIHIPKYLDAFIAEEARAQGCLKSHEIETLILNGIAIYMMFDQFKGKDVDSIETRICWQIMCTYVKEAKVSSDAAFRLDMEILRPTEQEGPLFQQMLDRWAQTERVSTTIRVADDLAEYLSMATEAYAKPSLSLPATMYIQAAIAAWNMRKHFNAGVCKNAAEIEGAEKLLEEIHYTSVRFEYDDESHLQWYLQKKKLRTSSRYVA